MSCSLEAVERTLTDKQGDGVVLAAMQIRPVWRLTPSLRLEAMTECICMCISISIYMYVCRKHVSAWNGMEIILTSCAAGADCVVMTC